MQQKEQKPCQNTEATDSTKFKVFFSALFVQASLATLLAVFSIIKDRLNKQLQLQQTFLSLLDNFLFGGMMMGTIFILLFPPKYRKRSHFISVSLLCLFQLLMPAANVFKQNGKYLMLIGMGGMGVCKAFCVIPFFFMSQTFTSEQQRPKLSIWNALNHIGDIFGIFFSYFSIYTLGIRWDISYQIAIFLYFISALIFFLVVEEKIEKIEKKTENQSNNHQIINYKIQKQTNLEDLPPIQKLLRTFELVKIFLSRLSNILWCADYVLQLSFLQTILFWIPYYFVQNGFGSMTIYITVAYFLANMAGTLIFQLSIRKYFSKEASKKICAFLNFLQCLVLLIGTIVLKQDKKHGIYYIMMLTAIGFIGGCVLNQVVTVDFVQIVGSDDNYKFSSLFLTRVIQNIVNILFNLVIGKLMLKDQRSLFYVMNAMAIIFLVVYISRKFFIVHQNIASSKQITIRNHQYIELQQQGNHYMHQKEQKMKVYR